MTMLKYFLFVSLFLPSFAWAFPEMVRHGYSNCTSCHVSPGGGGVLTQYGRELSREILSTWGNENEGKFLWGVTPLPEWLSAGGDFRALQLYEDDPVQRSGRFFFMQGDLEAAATIQKWTLVGSVGWMNGDGPSGDELSSRRHYLIYRPTDQISLRAGRFLPTFGINTAEHFIVTRERLGFDVSHDTQSETYNLEAAWLDDRKNIYVTGILGRPDKNSLDREKGIATQASLIFSDRFKAGLSHYFGSNSSGNRHIIGPFGILGFTPHFFLLTETDFQRIGDSSPDWGWVNYQRLDYEFIQGVHAYATQEFSRRKFSDASTLFTRYGLGLQFFPRPHFEINLEWAKQKTPSPFGVYTDFAWLLLHLYL